MTPDELMDYSTRTTVIRGMFHLSHSRPHPSQSAKLINYSNRLNQADRDLWNQACEVIWTDEMKIARTMLG